MISMNRQNFNQLHQHEDTIVTKMTQSYIIGDKKNPILLIETTPQKKQFLKQIRIKNELINSLFQSDIKSDISLPSQLFTIQKSLPSEESKLNSIVKRQQLFEYSEDQLMISGHVSHLQQPIINKINRFPNNNPEYNTNHKTTNIYQDCSHVQIEKTNFNSNSNSLVNSVVDLVTQASSSKQIITFQIDKTNKFIVFHFNLLHITPIKIPQVAKHLVRRITKRIKQNKICCLQLYESMRQNSYSCLRNYLLVSDISFKRQEILQLIELMLLNFEVNLIFQSLMFNECDFQETRQLRFGVDPFEWKKLVDIHSVSNQTNVWDIMIRLKSQRRLRQRFTEWISYLI